MQLLAHVLQDLGLSVVSFVFLVVPSMHSKLHIRQLDREEKNAGWHSGMSEIGAGDVGAEFGQYLTAPKPQP